MSFSCSTCGTEYPIDSLSYRCTCGGSFQLNYTPVRLPIASLSQRNKSIWRYREALPIDDDKNIVTMGEGGTPLIPFIYNDFDNLFAKLDFLSPTGSFKDRGSSIMSSKLKEVGVSSCIADSSGNAGSSIAAYTTKAGVLCKIFCPESTSEGKLIQIKAYGAELVKVPGNRSDTAAAVQREAETYYYASQNWNPFYLEGIKTLAFEICEQMDWCVPDAILCPVGYGGIYIGLYHGFSWLVETGIVSRYPRLIGIQTEAVSPVFQAFYSNAENVEEVPPGDTMAEGVACTKPVRGKKLLEIARETNGGFETVSEKDIIEGWRELNQQGLYVEPTSAVVIKALDRLILKNLIARTDAIVLILTGTGLKATEKLAKYVGV